MTITDTTPKRTAPAAGRATDPPTVAAGQAPHSPSATDGSVPESTAAGIRELRDRAALQTALAAERRAGRSIGLVPTMGALHAGHLALIEAARRECDTVLISIFVNPAQFGPDEDFEAYPRDQARDLKLAAGAGASLAYLPSAEQVYPSGFATRVEVDGLTEVLCGAPGSRGAAHFRGVTTVVCKLLNAIGPDRAYFGGKDAQQVAVIRRMVTDLEIPVEIRTVATVREADGLAMSSRNGYLSPAERERAAELPRALNTAREAVLTGHPLDEAIALARETLADAGIEPEYFEARDPDDLTPASDPLEGLVLLALAAPVGRTRLIDNLVIDPLDYPAAKEAAEDEQRSTA